MRFVRTVLLLLLGTAPALLPGQQGGTPLLAVPAYRLQTDDSFTVLYRITPEYNQTVSVQPDGEVNLQLLGSVPVRGLTLTEAQASIEHAAAKRLKNPELSLELKEYERPHFTVLGEVGKPGRYELRGPLSVEDGLALAGGLTTSARHTKIVVINRINDTTGRARLVDVRALEKPRPGMELLSLQPGDLIIVPQNKLSKVERYVKLINTGVYYNPAGTSF